ncbi:kinesin-related [Holotrichia oblita]|uniref:Kinesin-related n=2 Tax=Holotrichia oblita TaxID=644536 RepID=A0ACB9T9S1_HOLOL|nr:kinesin-related [Holotrichia oblita]KAI4463533.1 kinesin-related [Holotrichia oblita]
MDYLRLSRNEQLSFLRARDPSILSGNLASKRENVRTNLMPDIQENELEEADKNIQIHLRIKYADMDESYKIEANEIQCSIPTSSSHLSNLKDIESIVKKFTFSHIFPPESTQEEIFNLVVKPKLLKFINGENSTLMSYGASGSGKTFTIVGTITDPGIIPRTLEYLFKTLPELPETPLVKPTYSTQVEMLNASHSREAILAKKNLLSLAKMTIDERHTNIYQEMQSRLSTEPAGILDDFSSVSLAVWVSFCEIYNENIHDLLTPMQKQKGNRAKLKLASYNENTYIKDLTNICVSSGIEAYQILQYGLHNLKYASTTINPHSSRSHCIFTIKIAQVVNGTNVYRLNYFNFCDLAGSERLKKTMNEGDRLKESNNINASLLVLGRCINCIRENQKRNLKKIVPYRDSKLTRLFQRALSGNESISMIVNINPTANMFEESLHTLNFSAVAKEVVVKRTPMKIKTKSRFSSYLQARNLFAANQEEDACEINRMQDLIDKLYLELERQTQYCTEQEVRIRDEIWEQQNAVIEEIKENSRQQIAANNDRYKRYIQGLKDLYEAKANQREVIDLVSSSDEDEDGNHKQQNLREEINSLKVKLTDVENENILLKNRLHDTEKTCTQAQEQIEAYKEQIITLKTEFTSKIRELDLEIVQTKNTYETALQEYEDQASMLVNENYKLVEENSELNTQIETYTEWRSLQINDIHS